MTLRRQRWWATRSTTRPEPSAPPRTPARPKGPPWPRRFHAGRRHTRAGSDVGSATAELAVGLPALVMMMFAAMTAVSAVLTQLECVDAAREAARAAARGEAGEAAGRRVGPDEATVSLTAEGGTMRATVSVRVHPLGGRLPGFDVSATAVAATEPGVGGES